MEGVRTFLESSTIHGLTYISTTRKYARFFWILVVIAGFIAASQLIYDYFQNFNKSPTSTTIETWSISKVTFPTITVCPARDTQTNLNYDLVNTELYHLSKEERINLVKLFYESFQEIDYKIILEYMREIRLNDSLRNFYEKLTPMRLPSKEELVGNKPMNIEIDTFATSGQIKTPFFGKEIFDPKNFKLYVRFDLNIYIPKSVKKSNATIDIRIDHDIAVEQEYIRIQYEEIDIGKNKSFEKKLNVRDCYSSCRIDFTRSMTKEAFKKWKNKRFTGMRVTWKFNGNIEPEEKWVSSYLGSNNDMFCKIVNILKEGKNNKDGLWEEIKEKRPNISNAFFSSSLKMNFEEFFDDYENVSSEPINAENVRAEDLKIAEEMLVYLGKGSKKEKRM